MKIMMRLIHRNSVPYLSSSQVGSVHLIPRMRGVRCAVTRKTVPAASCRQPVRHLRSGRHYPAGVERAPYDPMPHGPAEVGVGPWEGPLPVGEQYDAELLVE